MTSTGEIFVSERIFNQAPGADLGDTEGLCEARTSVVNGRSRHFSIVDSLVWRFRRWAQ